MSEIQRPRLEGLLLRRRVARLEEDAGSEPITMIGKNGTTYTVKVGAPDDLQR